MNKILIVTAVMLAVGTVSAESSFEYNGEASVQAEGQSSAYSGGIGNSGGSATQSSYAKSNNTIQANITEYNHIGRGLTTTSLLVLKVNNNQESKSQTTGTSASKTSSNISYNSSGTANSSQQKSNIESNPNDGLTIYNSTSQTGGSNSASIDGNSSTFSNGNGYTNFSSQGYAYSSIYAGASIHSNTSGGIINNSYVHTVSQAGDFYYGESSGDGLFIGNSNSSSDTIGKAGTTSTFGYTNSNISSASTSYNNNTSVTYSNSFGYSDTNGLIGTGGLNSISFTSVAETSSHGINDTEYVNTTVDFIGVSNQQGDWEQITNRSTGSAGYCCSSY